MFIKQGNKIYKVQEEYLKDDIVIEKRNLKKVFDNIDIELEDKIKELRKSAKQRKQWLKDKLDELNNI